MKLGWIIHYVNDVAATLEFYERAFGLARKFMTEEQDYGELVTGDTTLAFASEALIRSQQIPFRAQQAGGEVSATQITLVTDTVETAYEKALAAGARSLQAVSTKPWGQTVAHVADLNGFVVELATPISG